MSDKSDLSDLSDMSDKSDLSDNHMTTRRLHVECGCVGLALRVSTRSSGRCRLIDGMYTAAIYVFRG